MKRPDAFVAALDVLRAVYDAEVARLAQEYRVRILAGEFSGNEDIDCNGQTGKGIGGPRFLRLERELQKAHSWLATLSGRLAVQAASPWLAGDRDKSYRNPKTGEEVRDGCEYAADEYAAECMMHDVLAEAARRGWVKRMRYINDEDTYGLRVSA